MLIIVDLDPELPVSVVIMLGGHDRTPDVVWVAPGSTPGVLMLGCSGRVCLGLSAGCGVVVRARWVVRAGRASGVQGRGRIGAGCGAGRWWPGGR
jgi:hypothetical protein